MLIYRQAGKLGVGPRSFGRTKSRVRLLPGVEVAYASGGRALSVITLGANASTDHIRLVGPRTTVACIRYTVAFTVYLGVG
jgi:hypothetical protein